MIATDDFERVEVASQDSLRAWLESNNTQVTSVWLVTFKKHKGAQHLSTDHVLDALICFG